MDNVAFLLILLFAFAMVFSKWMIGDHIGWMVLCLGLNPYWKYI